MVADQSAGVATPWDDKLHEECGVYGVFGIDDASTYVALGLHALQHRGQEAAGIVSFDGEHFRVDAVATGDGREGVSPADTVAGDFFRSSYHRRPRRGHGERLPDADVGAFDVVPLPELCHGHPVLLGNLAERVAPADAVGGRRSRFPLGFGSHRFGLDGGFLGGGYRLERRRSGRRPRGSPDREELPWPRTSTPP